MLLDPMATESGIRRRMVSMRMTEILTYQRRYKLGGGSELSPEMHTLPGGSELSPVDLLSGLKALREDDRNCSAPCSHVYSAPERVFSPPPRR